MQELRQPMTKQRFLELWHRFLFIGIGTLIVLVAAWFTHVIVCFKLGLWGFLIAGALFFPVAIVHGIGIWFGVW